MHDEKPALLRFRIASVVGRTLVVAGLLWSLLLLSRSDPEIAVASGHRQTAPRAADRFGEPPIFSAPMIYDGHLDTGSIEFSAVTLNEAANRLVIADDEGLLFEFELTADGDPVVPARRTMRVEVGDSDIEGLAWIGGTTYVLAHESTGVLSVIDIPDGVQVIEEQHRLRTIETGIAEVDGMGIEGVAAIQNEDAAFVVVVEKPPRLLFITDAGAIEREVPLHIGLADVSDVWAAPDGTIWIVSHEDSVVVHLEIGTDDAIVQQQRLDLAYDVGRFRQAEGVTMSRDGTRLYVVGEGVGPYEFTFGFWSVDPS